MDLDLIGAGHHLAVLGVTLALRGGHNIALVAHDGGNDTLADLARVALSCFSHYLLLCYSVAAVFSAAI